MLRSIAMATLTLKLADDVKRRAETQASEAGFTSVDEYIASLIQGDDAVAIDAEVEVELLRGLDSGPSVPLTRELLDDIRDRARQA
jgi:hypothetical protein